MQEHKYRHNSVIKVISTNLIIEHYIKLPLQVHNTFLWSKDPTMAGCLSTGVQPSSVEVLSAESKQQR
jgi:hypothetical protein